jgi:hypothetical protein
MGWVGGLEYSVLYKILIINTLQKFPLQKIKLWHSLLSILFLSFSLLYCHNIFCYIPQVTCSKKR